MARLRRTIWALPKNGITLCSSTSFLVLRMKRVRCASVNGTTSTSDAFDQRCHRNRFDRAGEQEQIQRKRSTCRIRFIGNTEAPKGTFPLAIEVKTKYQSVQGVTISMMNPIQSAGWFDRKTAPSPQASGGVHIKLMSVLAPRNLMFLNASRTPRRYR